METICFPNNSKTSKKNEVSVDSFGLIPDTKIDCVDVVSGEYRN